MVSSLISFLLRGLSIYRWSNFPRIERPTSMDHGAFSLHVAYLVADLVEEKTGKKFDKLDLFKRALFSVFFNCAYSDISSDVKARVKQLRPDIYAQLCHKMHKGVLSWRLPKSIQTDLRVFRLTWKHLL